MEQRNPICLRTTVLKQKVGVVAPAFSSSAAALLAQLHPEDATMHMYPQGNNLGTTTNYYSLNPDNS